MPSANDMIAHSLTITKFMLKRFTEDLKADEYLHRPTEKANCTAWLVGHLALSDRTLLERLGARDLPELPEGFTKRFSRDAGCAEAKEFGDVSTLVPLFEKHRDMLIATLKRAPADLLDKPLEKPHAMFKTIGEMVIFMSAHTAMHVGQITIIRRSLGRPPIV
jgi:hypothetical protein